MKKALLVVLVLVIIGIGAVLITHKNKNSATAGSRNNTMQNMPMTSASPTTGPSSTDSTAQATNSVTIQDFAFSPATITVKKGTTVTWTNQDATAHTVTENDGRDGPKSGDLGKGQSYSFTYNSTGTFKYHCSIHPDMLGTVTVTE